MVQKALITVFLFLFSIAGFSQGKAFDDGEWLKFRVHYGIFNASYATIQVDQTTFRNKPVYHVIGKGKSTGMLHLFFKVDDNYETFIDVNDSRPYRFIRKIDEGGYTKDLVIDFDHEEDTALVYDRKHNTKNTYKTADNVHDMLSAFYYLRDNLDTSNLKIGQEVYLNMFFDDENYPFKLKFTGREVVKTSVGKISCLKFKPHVLAGRVFDEKESLTFWISDDDNRIPVKISAKLAVGSLDADLESFKGLKHPLKIIMN